jgi:mannose-6-phosphate isomerase-like protein (cupin superfamily)
VDVAFLRKTLGSDLEGSIMAGGVIPIRRVVTGNDEAGRSRVLFDGPAPQVRPSAFQFGTNFTDIWVIDSFPADITSSADATDRPFHFEPPERGAVIRVIQSTARPDDYNPASDKWLVPEHPPRRTEGGTWERGGQSRYTTRIHKSETLDYGIMLAGERTMLLDDGEYLVKPGDVVVQVGSWHSWTNPDRDSLMAFVMIDAEFGEETLA